MMIGERKQPALVTISIAANASPKAPNIIAYSRRVMIKSDLVLVVQPTQRLGCGL